MRIRAWTAHGAFALLLFALGASPGDAAAPDAPAAAAVVESTSPPAGVRETLTNQSIAELVSLGLSDEIVIAKIRGAETSFDTSVEGLKSLKAAGVSNPVIAAMLDPRGSAPAPAPAPRPFHESGIYLVQPASDGTERFAPIPAVPYTQAKANTAGFILTLGLADINTQGVLNGVASETRIRDPRPAFVFFFNPDSAGFGNLSPRDFTLVRLKVLDEKNRKQRVLTVAKMNLIRAKGGVMEESQVPFDATLTAPGTYRVTPRANLTHGEYGFVLAQMSGAINPMTGMPSTGNTGNRIWDFGVDVAPSTVPAEPPERAAR